MRTREKRRKLNWSKARRKKEIAEQIYGFEWYDNLHQYSKNKIHCSCWMCRSKTNPGKKQGWGPKMNWSITDLKKLDSLNFTE